MFDSIIAFIIVLGILVFIHELGHFLLAKRNRVRVGTFSLGFGPRLFGYKHGDTDYRISLIPLGGYVKLAGEDPQEEATGASWELSSKSVSQRFSIFFAGPAMNILLALVINMLIGIIGIKIPSYFDKPADVVWVRPESQAHQAGLQKGDRIVQIGSTAVTSWEEVTKILRPDKTEEQILGIQRGDERLSIPYQPTINQELSLAEQDFGAEVDILVGSISKDYPAEQAGLRVGDHLVLINGIEIKDAYTVQQQVLASQGHEIDLTIERNAERLQFKITPRFDEAAQKWLIGIGFKDKVDTVFRKLSAPKAFIYGFTETWSWTKDLFVFLGKLVTGKAPFKSLGGPILIAQVAGEAWREGINTLLYLMAFLSLNLAVINLLPIPVLDGGHIMFLIPEIITKRPVNERFRAIAQQIGLAFFLVLTGLIIYVDLTR